MGVENLSLSWDNMTLMEERHHSIAAAYDAQLGLPWLTPSSNGSGVADWYLYSKMLSRVLTSPML